MIYDRAIQKRIYSGEEEEEGGVSPEHTVDTKHSKQVHTLFQLQTAVPCRGSVAH